MGPYLQKQGCGSTLKQLGDCGREKNRRCKVSGPVNTIQADCFIYEAASDRRVEWNLVNLSLNIRELCLILGSRRFHVVGVVSTVDSKFSDQHFCMSSRDGLHNGHQLILITAQSDRTWTVLTADNDTRQQKWFDFVSA